VDVVTAVLRSVLVANRGEIARRVLRTLRALGIRGIAVYADDDRDAPHVREADEALRIDTYLSIAAVVAAARAAGADALHPGYGFLSENAALARACADAGIVFVGPPPAAIELMGDKLRAKAAAAAAGVPVVPSFSVEQARAAVDAYPLLVKAAAGGGGRGMRVVEAPAQLDDALAAAAREARAGFGDERVFVERYLPRARHIEVQVLADAHGTVLHLGERECSLQRRHQKLVEESPSPVVDAELRATLGAEAVALARAAGYVGAGTVEFIADAADPATHYFLEMNARLQVEHPVTELVTGLDLVELQLRVAAGERLPLTQADVVLRGHAIEARVNAEDAAAGYLPAAGTVHALRLPAALRVDAAIERGTVVGTSYDSLLAKLVAFGEDREQALARLDRGLADTAILGVTTTVAALRDLLALPAVRAGELDTGLVEREAAAAADGTGPARDEAAAVLAAGDDASAGTARDEPAAGAARDEAAAVLAAGDEAAAVLAAGDEAAAVLAAGDEAAAVLAAGAAILLALAAEEAGDDPFARRDGWRLGGVRAASHWTLALDGGAPEPLKLPPTPTVRSAADAFLVDGREWIYARAGGDVLYLGREGRAHELRAGAAATAADAAHDGQLRAPMPGQVLLVPRAVGDRVSAGDAVVVLESMKMELAIAAQADGTVVELSVSAGDTVRRDQPLARVA